MCGGPDTYVGSTEMQQDRVWVLEARREFDSEVWKKDETLRKFAENAWKLPSTDVAVINTMNLGRQFFRTSRT